MIRMSVAKVECNHCKRTFEVDTEYFQKYGSDPFCADCLVHSECEACGRGIRLQPSKYRELGGEPLVCADCSQQTRSSQTQQLSENDSSSNKLTTGEKIVSWIAALVAGGLLFVALINPEIQINQVGPVIATCVIVIIMVDVV